MNDQAASVQPASSAAHTTAGAPSAPLWHLGWAVGALAAAAALMTVLGDLSFSVAAALALGAVPGLLGYFWQPAGQRKLALLAVWTVAVCAAAAIAGGISGPLAVWCAAPLLAGALIGKPAEGVVLSACAAAVMALVQLAGVVPPPPTGAFGVGLAAVGLVSLGGAAAAAMGILLGRGRDRQAAHADDPAVIGDVDAAGPADAADAVWRGQLETRIQALENTLGLARSSRDQAVTALAQADDARAAAALAGSQMDTRVQALENSYRIVAQARDQALKDLAEAKAARAAAEAAREQADAGAVAKSRFLANMSHELRTPLNAIMGFSDIMRARMFGELSPKYGEYAELIHESGRHLTDLINDVLDMSKIEAERYALDLDLFDAREPVSGALRLLRLQADDMGVQLRGVLPQAATMVDADRRALKQIVLNLVSNALKFTPKGGSITVTLQAVGEALELVVADTGVGIAKEDLDRLGQPYEQAGDAQHRAQGTGLGLSLVRAFARLHGGEMSIESELGEGAAVTVRLPVLHVETPEARSAPPPFAEHAQKRKETPGLGLEPEREAAPAAASAAGIAAAAPAARPDDAPRAEFQAPPKSAEIIPLNLTRL